MSDLRTPYENSTAEKTNPSSSTVKHLLILAAIAVVLCLPVLLHGIPDWGNDSILHARWAKHFCTQFWAGEWYPRWVSGVNYGYGAPSFYFQPALPHYTEVAFWPLLRHVDPEAWWLTGFSATLSIFLSAVGVYFWARGFAASTQAALFGAIVYAILPYHIAVNVYTRGAMGELWACVWPPLILLSINGLIRGSKWAFPGLAASYGLLVFNHLPTTLCFSLVPLAAALYLSEPRNRMRTFIKTCAAMAIGVGLAASFLLPAMLDQKKAYVDAMAGGWFDYRNWWLFQLEDPLNARMRLMFVTLAMLGFTLVALYLAWRANPDKPVRRQLIFQASVLFGAIFMASQLSAPIWSVIVPLRQMQFPTRFLQVFIVPVAGIAALAFPYLWANRRRIPGLIATAFLFSWIVADVWGASRGFRVWRPFPADLAQTWANLTNYEQEYFSFWPRPARMRETVNFPEFAQFVAKYPPRSMELIDAKGNHIAAPVVREWKPRQILVDVNASEPARLTIRHFYYAGWQGKVAGSNRIVPVSPSNPDGFLQLDVPKGQYQMTIELLKEGPERIGDWISQISILALAGIVAAIALRRPTTALR